jgi:hypothetical protein
VAKLVSAESYENIQLEPPLKLLRSFLTAFQAKEGHKYWLSFE